MNPVPAFVAAVQAGTVGEVRRLLARHPRLKKKLNDPLPGFDFGGTALLAATNQSNQELVDLLLDAGANINVRSDWWAGGFGVLDGDTKLVRHLIVRGAAVDAYAAARHGMLDRLRSLVAKDRSAVHTRGGDGQTPLHVAASVEVAAFLLEHGADIDALDVDHESTAAQYLIRDHTDVARYLVSRGCATDLLLAAALGDLALVEQHLDANPARIAMAVNERWFPMRNSRAGGSIYIWTLGGHKTAHIIAREFGHDTVFRLLLDRSPDTLKLYLACALGDEAAVRLLLNARPGLAATLGEDDHRKLVDAAEANTTEVVRLMLEAGWPTTGRGSNDGSALHWAAWHGNIAMVKDLLRYHAQVDLVERTHRQTPLGWARDGVENSWHKQTGNYPAVMEALRDAAATS